MSETLNGQSSIFSAEIVAIELALKHVFDAGHRQVFIYTDSLSALKALSVLSDRVDSALRLLVLLQNAGISVRFIHIGVPGNEAADLAAKAACSVRSDAPVFGADLLALLRRQVLGVWQSHWDRETENKLFQIKPKIVCWQSAFSRRDEVALCRLRIGHCRLTHGFLMSRDPLPKCVADGVQLSVAHIFTACSRFSIFRFHCFGHRSLLSLDVLDDCHSLSS
uniref:RNase H type-1 domain-containing protein n=1 Tax=Strigamia maritima TaxID=126957 RepID=T1J9C9_STRMM